MEAYGRQLLGAVCQGVEAMEFALLPIVSQSYSAPIDVVIVTDG
jgi:hypothetical protein